MTAAPRPALFLDRDGVINADRGFVAHRQDFDWQDGIFDLVRSALARGYVPVIVTNQSGIGRGLYTQSDYETLTAWMLDVFVAQAAPIARVYHCPYHPEAEIAAYRADHPWRKPAPGMLLAAAADLGLDLANSILVGDRWSDVGAGRAASVGHIILVGRLAQTPMPAQDEKTPGLPLVRCNTIRDILHWFDRHERGRPDTH